MIKDDWGTTIRVDASDARSGAFILIVDDSESLGGSAAVTLSRRQTKSLIRKLKKAIRQNRRQPHGKHDSRNAS